MGLTDGHDVFAALGESGLNEFLTHLYDSRPHYFAYATAAMGGGSTDVSLVSQIPIPGGTSGIDFSLQIGQPQVHLFPLASPQTFPLPVATNQFGIHVPITLDVIGGAQVLALRRNTSKLLSIRPRATTTIPGSLDLYAVGHPISQISGQGTFVSLWIDTALINGAGNLSDILTYIGEQMLDALLTKVQIPVSAISLGAFTIRLAATGGQINNNPEISDNQLKIWADIL